MDWNSIFNAFQDSSRSEIKIESQYKNWLIIILDNLVDTFNSLNENKNIEETNFIVLKDYYVCIRPLNRNQLIKNKSIFLKSVIGLLIFRIFEIIRNNFDVSDEKYNETIIFIQEIKDCVDKNWIEIDLSFDICIFNPYINGFELICITNSLSFCKFAHITLPHLPSNMKSIELGQDLLSSSLTEVFQFDFQNVFDSITDVENLNQTSDVPNEEVVKAKTNDMFSLIKNSGLISSISKINTEIAYGVSLEELYQKVKVFREENHISIPIKIHWNCNEFEEFYAFSIMTLELRRLGINSLFNSCFMHENNLVSVVLKLIMKNYGNFSLEDEDTNPSDLNERVHNQLEIFKSTNPLIWLDFLKDWHFPEYLKERYFLEVKDGEGNKRNLDIEKVHGTVEENGLEFELCNHWKKAVVKVEDGEVRMIRWNGGVIGVLEKEERQDEEGVEERKEGN